VRLVFKALNARQEMARKKADGIEPRAHLYDLQQEAAEAFRITR